MIHRRKGSGLESSCSVLLAYIQIVMSAVKKDKHWQKAQHKTSCAIVQQMIDLQFAAKWPALLPSKLCLAIYVLSMLCVPRRPWMASGKLWLWLTSWVRWVVRLLAHNPGLPKTTPVCLLSDWPCLLCFATLFSELGRVLAENSGQGHLILLDQLLTVCPYVWASNRTH